MVADVGDAYLEIAVQPRAHHWTAIDRSGVQAGDIVSAEAGGLPIYLVLDLQGQTTLLRETKSGREHVAPLSALHWKLASPAAL